MPLPRSHFESLEQQLRVHEERLGFLRWHLNNVLEDEMRQKQLPTGERCKVCDSDVRQEASKAIQEPHPKTRSPEWVARRRKVLEREILIHEQLIDLGRNPKVLAALRDLIIDRAYASEVTQDPKGAALKRGIELPANMTLRLYLDIDRVRLQIISYEELFPFMLTWNSDSGFSPPIETCSLLKGPSDVSSVA